MSRKLVSVAFVAGLVALLTAAGAQAESASIARLVFAQLSSFQEAPARVSSASGWLRAEIDLKNMSLSYTVGYLDLTSDVTQIHLHIGQSDVNGEVAAFLCSNLGNGPAGTQPCPTNNGQITGTLTAEDILGAAAAQGVGAGEIDKLFLAIRGGAAYVNVHTVDQPTGAIRGQLRSQLHRSLERPQSLGHRGY